MPFQQAIVVEPEPLIGLLSTVMAPRFCEFVLELKKLPSKYSLPSSEDWSRWIQIDRFLDERFAGNRSFKVIIRTSRPHDRVLFQRQAKCGFPLLAKRKCVHFEVSDDIGVRLFFYPILP